MKLSTTLFVVALATCANRQAFGQITIDTMHCKLDTDCKPSDPKLCKTWCEGGMCFEDCRDPPPPPECKVDTDCKPTDPNLCKAWCEGGMCYELCDDPPTQCKEHTDCEPSDPKLCKAWCDNGQCVEDCMPPPTDGICASTDECPHGEYCAAGKCLPAGYCAVNADCVNPTNVFSSNTCDGFFSCNVDGYCAKRCSETGCPVGRPPVDCAEDPCKTTQCDEEHVSCVPNKCGGCNAIFFNAAGERVCRHKDDTGVKIPCEMSSDCDDDKYCANNLCVLKGTCFRASDCKDPANVFPPPKCDGENQLVCKNYQCAWNCL